MNAVAAVIPVEYLDSDFAGQFGEFANQPGQVATWRLAAGENPAIAIATSAVRGIPVHLDLDTAEAFALSLLGAIYLQRTASKRGPRLPHTHDPDGDGTEAAG